ncbi:hypothetical protein [Ensifer soli]|uniref:hypothetical protein n=1 Tax=Ciceribacter sp. sgz301302 TaxID=3342379 RepID=UPI0035B717F1
MSAVERISDAVPLRADNFSDLAERRAWLATLPTKTKPVLAWPTAERLARLDSPTAAQALYRYAALMEPMRFPVANDNDPDVAAPVGDLDMVHETRPGVEEMMRAAEDGTRCAVVSTKVEGRWQVVSRRTAAIGLTEEGFRLGGLLFREGRLVSYGSTAKGATKTPAERTRQPKGRKQGPRSEASIRYLLPANDNAPIADGSGWLGGVTRPRGNTSRPDIDSVTADEMHRARRREAIRTALGADVAVLDLAITDATAREIGEALGYTGKTAERQGIARINAAIAKLQKVAA